MRNEGLATANAIGSALDTYGQLQNIDANKQAVGLRDADQKMQQEAHAAKMKSYQSQEASDAEANNHRVNQLNARKMRVLNGAGLEWSPENQAELTRLGGRLGDVGNLLSPDMGDAITSLEGVLSGKLNMNDPAAIKAANQLANVQKGATEGRKVNINRIVPSEDGSSVHLGLHSVDADGMENANAVLTKNRSALPEDEVESISIDNLVKILGTAKQSRQTLQNPKMMKAYMDFYDPVPTSNEGTWDKATYNEKSGMYEQTNKKTGETKLTRDGVGDAAGRTNAGGGSGGNPAGGSTSNVKDIEYFRSLGYSTQDAVDLVVNRGASPSQEITRMAVEMMKGSKDEDGVATLKMEDAMNQATDYYNKNLRKQIQPAAQPTSGQPAQPTSPQPVPQTQNAPQAPQAALDALAQNPKLADAFKAKYGYLPQ